MSMDNLNLSSIAGQMRLLTGDYSSAGDDPWLSDEIYTWFYKQNKNSLIDGSIAALESIINQVALRPVSITNNDVSESWNGTVVLLSARLVELKAKRDAKRNSVVPVLIKSDRKNWNDFNDLFGSN